MIDLKERKGELFLYGGQFVKSWCSSRRCCCRRHRVKLATLLSAFDARDNAAWNVANDNGKSVCDEVSMTAARSKDSSVRSSVRLNWAKSFIDGGRKTCIEAERRRCVTPFLSPQCNTSICTTRRTSIAVAWLIVSVSRARANACHRQKQVPCLIHYRRLSSTALC